MSLQPIEMDADEARERVERVKAAVSQTREDLVALWRERAWLSLGYASWDDLCDAEFGVRLALPREERREAVAELRAEGMSTRAIGSALGVNQATVVRDLGSTDASASVDQPARVTSLDGRERPATQPSRTAPAPAAPEPFDVEPAIERYPDLDAWRDQPDRVEALAGALDGYGPTERATRLDALAKSAAARREGRIPGPPAPRDDRADRLFDHVNSALRTAQTVSPEEFAELADPQHREMWRSQFIKATAVLSLYADVLSSAPALRSVR